MSEIEHLKVELQILSGRIQAERNDEVRHGLQRGRLEAERFQLLVKMMEAMTVDLVQSDVPVPPVTEPPDDDDAELPAEPMRGHKHKPDGLPTYQEMVQRVLEHVSPRWLAPRQMTAMIQQTWWPDIAPNKAASTAWGMARRGMIDKRGRKYRVKSNGHAQQGNGADARTGR